MRLMLLALIAALNTACATTPSQTVAAPERVPPTKCLTLPKFQPYRLPDWYDKATPEDKAALELNAKAIDVAAIRERDSLLADCRAWFGVEKQ